MREGAHTIRENSLTALAPTDRIEVYFLDPACQSAGPGGPWLSAPPGGADKPSSASRTRHPVNARFTKLGFRPARTYD